MTERGISDQEIDAALKAFYPGARPGPWPWAAKDLMRAALEAALAVRLGDGEGVNKNG